MTYGAATETLPATAQVLDEHGRKHFVQIKAEGGVGPVPEGESLVIVDKVDGFFLGRPVR